MNEPTTISLEDASRWKQTRFNPLVCLNAGTLATLRDGFDAGYLRGFALLMDQIAEVDDTIGTVIEKRVSQVARRPWDVLIGEEVPDEKKAEAELHQAALKFFFSNLKTRNAIRLDERGGLHLLLRQMMQAVILRFAAHEIVWEPSNAGMSATLWSVPLAFLEETQGKLRFAGPMGTTPGKEMPEENWLITVSHGAKAKALCVLYLLKRLSLSDWTNFMEKFGTPGLQLETNATPGSKEWNEAVEALRNYAKNWSVVTTTGQKIHLIQVSGGGDAPFGPMVDLVNRAVARVLLGSDLATMSRENGAGASLQGDDSDELISGDCEWLNDMINAQLCPRVIEWQFGEGTLPLAHFKLAGPQREDTKLQMDVDKHVKEFGVNLSREDVAERYGRTHVEADPASLPAQPVPAANESVVPQALKNLHAITRAKVQKGLKNDLKAAEAPLLRIENATDFQQLRAALADLDPEAVHDAVLESNELQDAMEVFLGAQFLAGLAYVQGESATPPATTARP